MRKFLVGLALLVVAGSLAMAQVTIFPTTGSGDDAYGVDMTGTDGVYQTSVSQDVTLELPPVVALHLDVTDLTFDISQIGSQGLAQDNTWACVYGPGYQTSDSSLGAPDWASGQEVTLPLGTYYTINGKWEGTTAPSINIVGLNGSPIEVTSYPPIQIDGELVPGSKNHFVCYRSFILQKFSNFDNWDLTVTRSAGEGQSAFQMYLQDNSVCTINNHSLTGLFELLPGGEPISLLADAYTSGTTGALAEECNPTGGKSWLDDLMVLAVKVDGEHNGTNTSTITYTITSPDPDVIIEPELE